MREYFINIAIDQAIKLYLSNSKDQDGLIYNSFLVVTIRILALIYNEADLLNPYYLNNEVVFMNNLTKYGMSITDVHLFKDELFNYYNFECNNESKEIKEKNPYFIPVLKYLVDMFVAKKNNYGITYEEEETFLELAYTSHTTNPYRVSYNYLVCDNPLYIEKYYYSKINSLEVTKDLSKTINLPLNLEALNYVGVNLTNLKNMSDAEIAQAQKDAFNYFQVDATSANRNELLENSLEYLKTYGKRKITTGNGYVDILLLMSVIATSLSVFAIIIFTL